MKFVAYCNRAIEYLFYALFLLVPLVFAGNTSELFEFSKMWLTFGIAIAIGFFWISKMAVTKKLIFRRTILDIPIALFLVSQVISTVLSLDHHISLWGYYSRWNGGLLSIFTYIFFYYAFVSNVATVKVAMRSIWVSLVSGLLVVLWALPSHFGHDPTCLLFRGHFDVSCWTNDFQPKIRMFGSMGQPDWLAGYLGILLPITGALLFDEFRKAKNYLKEYKLWFYAVSFVLFYISLLFTSSRAGIGGTVFALLVLGGGYIFLNRKNPAFLKNKILAGFLILLILISFFAGVELPGVNKISWSNLSSHLHKTAPAKTETATPAAQAPSTTELGGSNSFEIRKIVWKGAINAWEHNPIFGTGVETFGFAYYKYKPVEQNTVSEWNFLYNKAHNEYLNYLATTGAVGLLTYLGFIALFGAFIKTNLLNLKFKQLKVLKAETKWDEKNPLILGLATAFLAILVINFFGFSVVIMNIYLFIIPALVLVLYDFLGKEMSLPKIEYINYFQWLIVCLVGVVGIFGIFTLGKYWIADTKYALGFNYDQVQQFQTAYPLLHEAVNMRHEPVFMDEMSINDAVLATSLGLSQSSDSANLAQNLASEAIATNDQLTKSYPNNVLFWKSRVRIMYTLSNVDPKFMTMALDAIKKTADMAPNDAQIIYNLGVLYGQTGDFKNAISALQKTVAERPMYSDAHFALGVFYHEQSVDKSGKITNKDLHQKALDEMTYILKKIDPNYQQAQQYFDLWNKEQ